MATKRGRARKGETYPAVGDVVSLVVAPSVRCPGVTLAVNPPSIATCFVRATFPDGGEPPLAMIMPSQVLDVKIHGPLGFNQTWRVHSPLPGFRREEWPPLVFYQRYMDQAMRYDEETLEPIEVTEVGGRASRWPIDEAAGHLYIEKALAAKLKELCILR